MEYIIYRDSDELYHHGVKGQKWGIRRVKDSQLYSKNRRQYRSEFEEKMKASNNIHATVRQERRKVLSDAIKSDLKGLAGTYGASFAITGAAALSSILGGPATGIAVASIAYPAAATLGIIRTGQTAVNAVNAIVKNVSISDIYDKYRND